MGAGSSSYEEDPIEPIVLEPKEPGVFIPSNFIARVRFEGGQYPNLLSPTAHAVWVDEHISEIKLVYENQLQGEEVDTELVEAAETINNNYIVIEVHVETLFEDTSIAYDISSLRNLDVHLETDTGELVYPIQQILGSSAGEEQVGSLKRFDRLNLLVFPMTDVITDQPTITLGTSTISLVIDGFDSRYTFTWDAQEPLSPAEAEEGQELAVTDLIRWRPTQSETAQLFKLRFTELYTKLAALSRISRR